MPDPNPKHRKCGDFIFYISALGSVYFFMLFLLGFSLDTLIGNTNLIWFFFCTFVAAVYGLIYGKDSKT